MGCYENNLSDNIMLAKQEFAKYNKSYLNINLFVSLAGNSIYDIKNEVQKISQLHTNPSITDNELKSSVYYCYKSHYDLLAVSLITGDGKNFFESLDEAFKINSNRILIVRAIIKFIISLIAIKQADIPKEQAIKSIKYPVFFTIAEKFQEILHTKSIAFLYKILKSLYQVEIDIKNSTRATQVLCSLFVTTHKEIAKKD
jgi:DNA polymerase III delta subunit